MKLPAWLTSIIGTPANQDQARDDSTDNSPTDHEMQQALDILHQMVKPAVFGKIGGEKPQKNNRATSWWGGNFLGAEGELVPVCQTSGRPLHPLIQIRVDELPNVPPTLSDIALLTMWIDLYDIPFHDAENGNGFSIRTYREVDDLVPIGPGYRESDAMPTFPVLWGGYSLDQPSWNDIAFKVPSSVARSDDTDWFFESQYITETNKYDSSFPVKVGGWPSWIQGENWPRGGDFCFQINSISKGRFNVGDSGSLYLFRTPTGWGIRADFY
ncbi:DUF1963 domain-containing protein [Agrobacterium vitis]|uniref:DUF1963 domain-containing protein n=1 Tax=Allorhizobium ampelinum TaxID=3025782 RepID=UPI001F1B1D20|nr:DUF1963 domain-containing protein [Allorhizobium ampelinum]MCF1485642.1 DUF1963 domain-containing protein [Allorhizobium ampelinum]